MCDQFCCHIHWWDYFWWAVFETQSKQLSVLMALISNYKHKIEEKSTKSSQSFFKVVGLGLADLWEFPTLLRSHKGIIIYNSEQMLCIKYTLHLCDKLSSWAITVWCHYNVVKYIMILHKVLQWLVTDTPYLNPNGWVLECLLGFGGKLTLKWHCTVL